MFISPSKAQTLLERSQASVWHPCTQMKQHERLPLLPITHGEGVWLYDEANNRYLDGISSWWVNLFGHCNARINARIAEQLGKLEHVMLAGFTHQPVVELSEKLAALTGHHLGHAFYASDGASATEIALKMSAHYWRNQGYPEKCRFVSIAGSYHGETAGALAVTDIALFREAYAPLVRTAATVPSPDARLAEPGESAHDYALRCAEALQRYFAQHHHELAAFIVEPLVQCASGMAMYEPIYLQEARRLCDDYKVLLIADEIAVGCGRTGSFFACEQAGIWPDFMCLSKGISGGYLPLSLVLSSNAVYAAFYDDSLARGFLHSHSYTGNPLACAAALATLDIFESDAVISQNQHKASLLAKAAHELAAQTPVSHLRQRGMILAFDVEKAPTDFAQRFFQAAKQHALLLRPIGNTVYWMPPYIIDEAQITQLAQGTLAALGASISP